MRFVLLGDMHVYRLYVQPWQLLSKRVLGQTNLWINRRLRFRMSLFDELIRHALSLEPAMLLNSGDLTTTSLPREFAGARRVMEPLLSKIPGMIVPGNHDRYTDQAVRRRTFERYFRDHVGDAWPACRQIGDDLHVIGLDVARPTWFFADTWIKPDQLHRLRTMLADINPDHRVIIVCHYPIGTPGDHLPERPSHAMHNADELRAVLAEAPQQMLYLHGHVHEPWCYKPEDVPNIVAINAGAPVMISLKWPMGQGLWEIEASGDGWALAHHSRDSEGHWRRAEVAVPRDPGDIGVIQPLPQG